MPKKTAYANKLRNSEKVAIRSPRGAISRQETDKSLKEEQQLNVWIPKDLMKRLKVKGIEADKSLKEMVTEAIEQFL